MDKMNVDPVFSSYYDNAKKFVLHSENNENWPEQIERDGISDINDYYERVKRWCQVIRQ